MDRAGLVDALAAELPQEVAEDLAGQFIEIRKDVATGTMGRASAGKFVESVVQSLQALENAGAFDSQPNVDGYLRSLESRQSALPEGLRICASRLARGMYSIRSKRNIVHKAEVDPAMYDLRFLYAGAQWVLAELLALAQGIDGHEAARLIAQVQLPVGALVEVLGDRKLVQADLSVIEEALVLLGTYYPDAVTVADVVRSMDRRNDGSVRNALSALWKAKLVHRPKPGHVVLTERGLKESVSLAQEHVE